MYERRKRDLIFVDNTHFIYATNFSGDPKRDKFGSTTRKGNIILGYEQAMDLMERGVNVKSTKPRPGEEEDFEPTYYVSVVVQYRNSDGSPKKYPPKVYLVSGDAEPVLLDEESIFSVDDAYVRNVNVILNPYNNPNTGRTSLYVTTMYVEQEVDEDPYAARYFGRDRYEDEDVPF